MQDRDVAARAWKSMPDVFGRRLSHGAYTTPDHVKLIAWLQLMSANRILRRIGVSLPPGHSKSESIDFYGPTWLLEHEPRRRVILSSYSGALAEEQAKRVRNLIEGNPHLLRTRIMQDTRAADRWKTTAGGGMWAVGIGGAITGRRASDLIIDDPMKNWAEAMSETVQMATWNWYGSTARTRLLPRSSIMVVQCMTGDTPVLMSDGSELQLADVRRGDRIATYEGGRITTAVVTNWASQGHDSISTIRMTSGVEVRANARHPFLTIRDGDETWTRTKDLKPGDIILRATGGSGGGSPAPTTDATNQRSARACACGTTTRRSGQTDIGLPHRREQPADGPICCTATASPSSATTNSSNSRAASAPCADSHRQDETHAPTGTASCASTTTTTPAESGVCCATTATWPSATGSRPTSSWPQLSTYSVTPDVVEAVTPAGAAEVFDIQVGRTENFIANGLVSHNTRWAEGDLLGRLEVADRDRDDWLFVKLPAIADEDETIETVLGPYWSEYLKALGYPLPRWFREQGQPLWPELEPGVPWYDLQELAEIRSEIGEMAWAGLYQQRPSPIQSELFAREKWVKVDAVPPGPITWVRRWDLAATQDGGDWTAGVLMGLHHQSRLVYIVDMVRRRLASEGVEELVASTALEDKERYGRVYIRIEREPGSSGKAVESSYKRRILPGYDVEFLPSTGDKTVRAVPLSGQQGARHVALVRTEVNGYFEVPSWWAPFIDEAAVFPHGKNDDMIDTASLGYIDLLELGPRRSRTQVGSAARRRLGL